MAKNYCIMNVKKQGRGAVYGLQIEANRHADDGREFDNSDIDKTQTVRNYYFRKCDNWNKAITKQIHAAGVKERKDSIVLLTGVYTASPEWFETHTPDEWERYFEDCLDFHERTYGKCLNAVVHLDEETPHMQVASVPIIEDEKGFHLSAKMIVGGRNDMRLRQDKFYAEVGKIYGMERGERREPAEMKAHTTKREWQKATQELEIDRNRIMFNQIIDQQKQVAQQGQKLINKVSQSWNEIIDFLYELLEMLTGRQQKMQNWARFKVSDKIHLAENLYTQARQAAQEMPEVKADFGKLVTSLDDITASIARQKALEAPRTSKKHHSHDLDGWER